MEYRCRSIKERGGWEARTELEGSNSKGAKRVTVRGLRFCHRIERLTAEEIEAGEDGEEGEDVEEFEVVGIQRC